MEYNSAIIALVLILAVTLDILIMVGLWHAYHREKTDKRVEGVYLSGAYSPVLSWLKNSIKRINHQSNNQNFKPVHGQEKEDAYLPSDEAHIVHPADNQEERFIPHEPQERNNRSIWHHLLPHIKKTGICITNVDNKLILLQKEPTSWITWVEILSIITWAIFAGRAYLDFSQNTWIYGSDYPLQILGYYVWRLLPTCGPCVFWNGWVSGGWPAFADFFSGLLHPLVFVSTLILGPISATKVVVVASMAIAGIAQWWLARVMRLGTLPRMWVAMIGVVGGQLLGRMEMGLIIMCLSIATTSLILAPALEFAMTGSRKAAIWLGVCMAMALVSGQGYMQLGLLFGVAPAYLILLWGEKLRQRAYQLNLLLAGGLTILISAVNWLPVVRFWGNIEKLIDPAFVGAQPISYIPLNMVISNYTFFTTEALQKKPIPGFYINYIGWIPVLLAFLTIFLVPRKARRVWLFFIVAIFAIYLASSGSLFRVLVKDLPFLAGARHPALISSLSVPFVLGLSGWGLELLLRKLRWPGLNYKAMLNGPSIYKLLWGIVMAGLIIGIIRVYQFTRRWQAVEIPLESLQAVAAVKDFLNTSSTEWIGYPYGDLPFAAVAINAGLKVNIEQNHRNFSWHGRNLPPAYIEAINEPISANTPSSLAQIDNYLTLIVHPDNQYAYIDTGAEHVTCQAIARGGDIDVKCDSPLEGRLIVYENMYDGWKAWMDGSPRRLLSSEWLSVDAPAGQHIFKFRYRPWDAILGSILTVIGLGLVALLVFIPDHNTQSDDSSIFTPFESEMYPPVL